MKLLFLRSWCALRAMPDHGIPESLRLTPGATPPAHIFRVTETFEAVWAMYKNVEGVAILSNLLQKSGQRHLLADARFWILSTQSENQYPLAFEEWKLLETDERLWTRGTIT